MSSLRRRNTRYQNLEKAKINDNCVTNYRPASDRRRNKIQNPSMCHATFIRFSHCVINLSRNKNVCWSFVVSRLRSAGSLAIIRKIIFRAFVHDCRSQIGGGRWLLHSVTGKLQSFTLYRRRRRWYHRRTGWFWIRPGRSSTACWDNVDNDSEGSERKENFRLVT